MAQYSESLLFLRKLDYPRYTAEEESQLVAQLRASIMGSPEYLEIRDQLFMSCIPLAIRLASDAARKRKIPQIELDDLISVALFGSSSTKSGGLLRAVETMDTSRGRLTTYATLIIRRALSSYAWGYGLPVSVPSYANVHRSDKLLQQINRFTARPAIDNNQVAVNQDPSTSLEVAELYEQLQLAIGILSPLESYVVCQYYAGATLQKIGRMVGGFHTKELSKERVRQIRDASIEKLRIAMLEKKQPD